MARRSQADTQEKAVDPELTAKALAKAVYEGDFVNFRLLFSPSSPARETSPERFETAKYAYLLPDETMEADRDFRMLHSEIGQGDLWRHIEGELGMERPARLPSELVLRLADNAVVRGKHTSASQAYELLRIRQRMQELFLDQADAAVARNAVGEAVRAYVIATGIEYDYAAFPEPLPLVPDFQTQALMLHGEYPVRPEDSVPLQEPEAFFRTAVSYLLPGSRTAARLETIPAEQRPVFLKALICERDPGWHAFAGRFREACRAMHGFEQRLKQASAAPESAVSLAQEIENELGEDPRHVAAILLGRTIEGGEWWQYLKELAYLHPAGALFVARQVVGDVETIVPRYRSDSRAARELGLVE